MSETLPPFRLKKGDDAGQSLAAVLKQVIRCRHRANAFVAQRAVYTIGAVALTTFCMLVGLAFVLSGVLYATVVWGSVAALVGLFVSTMVKAWNEWIPQRRASIAIDHRASLEDRLATLAAHPEQSSRLWDVLLRDNLRLLPRWTPRIFVPRFVPRSISFLLLALLLTLGILPRMERGTELAGSPAAAEAPEAKNALPPGGQAAEAEAENRLEEEGPLAFLSELPEKLREAVLSSAAHKRGAQIARGEGQLANDPASAAAELLEEGRASVGGEPRAGRSPARQGVREGAPPAVPGASDSRKENSMRSAPGGTRLAAIGKEPARGDRPKSLPRVETGRPHETSRRPPSKKGQAAGKGGGAQGAGSGGDRPGLFGPPDSEGKAAGSFALDLAGARNQTAGDREGDRDFGARPASDLATEQRLDDAIRRAQVPPEYELIIQRIFNHPDETESTQGESNLGTR